MTPSTTNINLWGGLAFVLGNLLFLLNNLDEMSRLLLDRWMADLITGGNPALILLGQLALILGYLAYYRCYAPRTGGAGLRSAGKNALRLFCGGGILLAIGHLTFMPALADALPSSLRPYAEALFLLVFIGLLLLLAGLIWFGILALRQPLVSHARWLPLVTGLMGAIAFFGFSGEEPNLPFVLFRSLFTFGLIGLGLTLAREP